MRIKPFYRIPIPISKIFESDLIDTLQGYLYNAFKYRISLKENVMGKL
jgi:hypothetical protein